jgi:hypothetical protein
MYHPHKLSDLITFHLGLIQVLKVISLICSSKCLDAQIRRLFYIGCLLHASYKRIPFYRLSASSSSLMELSPS